MTLLFIRRTLAIVVVLLLSALSYSQPLTTGQDMSARINKPYKILTSGKQITVKSVKSIKSIMVWTASGHRIVEEKAVNNSSYSFMINSGEKIFFVMIQYEGAKPYTEKIGVQ